MDVLATMSCGLDTLRFTAGYIKKILQGVAEDKPLSVRLRELQSLSKKLDGLALLSTFLASVQAITLQMAIEDNSTRIRIGTNAVAFAGLLFDVLGAAGCLSVSATVQKASILMEDLIDAENSLKDAMANVEQGELGAGGNKSKRLEVRAAQDRQQNLVAALQDPLFRTIKARADAFGSTISLGNLCLVASVICLAISSQPRAVWITAALIPGFVAFLSPLNVILERFGGVGTPGLIDMDEDPLRGIRANIEPDRRMYTMTRM